MDVVTWGVEGGGRIELRVYSADEVANAGRPKKKAEAAKGRVDPPHRQPPRMRWWELAERLLDPARSPAVVEQEALSLDLSGLRRLVAHADRRRMSNEDLVLNAEQHGVLESLRDRVRDLEFLEGDAPGGEG